MAEYRAVQITFVRLVDAIKSCVEKIASMAFQKELVTDHTLNMALNQMHQGEHRASTLVLHILDRIKLNPAHFDTFVCILESEAVLKDITDELKTKLCELSSSVVPKHSADASSDFKQSAAVSYDVAVVADDSQFTFPSLIMKGISVEEKLRYEASLYYESRKMGEKFRALFSRTFESLKERGIPIATIIRELVGFNQLQPVFEDSDQPAFRKQLSKLRQAETVDDIMDILIEYCSFFNLQIIESLISKLGTVEDKAALQKYNDDFAEYAKRKIYEMPSIENHKSENCQALIYVTLDKIFEQFTISELFFFQGKLCDVLQVSPGSLQLCHIKPGSVNLVFQVPSFVVPPVFPLSLDKEEALKALGIASFSYSFVYQFSSSNVRVR